MGGVDHATGPVQPRGRIQLGQQDLVQPLPDAGLVPVPKPPPARHARAETEVLRQVLPLDPGVQHVQDPAQYFPVRQRLTAGIPEPSLTLRQQRLQMLPQFIRHDPRRCPHTEPNAQLLPRTRRPGLIHLIVLALVRRLPAQLAREAPHAVTGAVACVHDPGG